MDDFNKQLLIWIESLGDNCELGFFLRHHGNESGSLCRWAVCPIENVTQFIYSENNVEGFKFEELEPSAPGMVRDLSSYFCFHTAMRSVVRDNELEFEVSEAERRILYEKEKQKYDYLASKFFDGLRSDENKIYVVKCNTNLTDESVQKLHEAIATYKKEGTFVLLAVKTVESTECSHEIAWQSDSMGFAEIERFAPYSEAFDIEVDSWSRIVNKLGESKVIGNWLSIAEAKQTDAIAQSEAKAVAAQDGQSGLIWNSEEKIEIKYELAYLYISRLETVEDIDKFIAHLKSNDSSFYFAIGGDLYDAIKSDSRDESLQEKFDERYLILIQLLSSYDLSYAIEFHSSSENCYETYGRSFIRYSRLKLSLDKTLGLVDKLKNSDTLLLEPVAPKYDLSFEKKQLALNEFDRNFSLTNQAKAELLRVNLPKELKRIDQRFLQNDDTDAAQALWINRVRTNDVKKLSFYMLPDAHVCKEPTGVSFVEDGARRYVYDMSDMYHYHRIAGRTASNKNKIHLEKAYILPRYGAKNYYHSLVDKLPALYGYKMLKLDCPIVTTYQLDKTELHFAELMGIDTANIIYNGNGQIQVKTALYPNIGGLRPNYFQHLASTSKLRSPFGKKIYISRLASPDRILTNEEQVHELVSRCGFEVVFMENYSLEQQMAIAGNAEILMGAHGAGLANQVFSKKGCCVIELIPDRYMTPLFKQLAIDCGHQYSVFLGEVLESDVSATKLDWRICLNKLEAALSSYMDQELAA